MWKINHDILERLDTKKRSKTLNSLHSIKLLSSENNINQNRDGKKDKSIDSPPTLKNLPTPI